MCLLPNFATIETFLMKTFFDLLSLVFCLLILSKVPLNCSSPAKRLVLKNEFDNKRDEPIKSIWYLKTGSNSDLSLSSVREATTKTEGQLPEK